MMMETYAANQPRSRERPSRMGNTHRTTARPPHGGTPRRQSNLRHLIVLTNFASMHAAMRSCRPCVHSLLWQTIHWSAKVTPTVCGHHALCSAPVPRDKAPYEHIARLVGPVAK